MPGEWEGSVQFHPGVMPRSAIAARPRVPMRNTSHVASSAPAASSTRSLKAPANPCSAQNNTSAVRPARLGAASVKGGIRDRALAIAAARMAA